MPGILTITMNPALDIVTDVERIEPWRKLRCAAASYFAGGGGVNVSQAIRRLGGESTAFLLASGPTGELLRDVLEADDIATVLCPSEGITRPSVNVFERDSGNQFRFVLDGPRQPGELGQSAEQALARLMKKLEPDYVVASGSLPPGIDPGFFVCVAELAREHEARFVLDTSGEPLIRAVEAGVYLVAPNRNEAKQLAAGDAQLESNPARLARALIERGRAEAVAVTLGGDGIVLVTKEGSHRVRAPDVELASPVGAGDSFVGGLVYALSESRPLLDACRYGASAAAAAVMVEEAKPSSRETVETLYARSSAAPEPQGQG